MFPSYPPEVLISKLNLESLLEELEKKDNFQTRIKTTLEAIEDCLPFQHIKPEQKNAEESTNFRKQADALVCKENGRTKRMIEAWEIYCHSIAKAETSSVELAKAYANRSAVLFKLNRIAECIRDIDRALALAYPDHLRANLLRRKARCLKILDNEEYEKVCEEARVWLENVNLNDEKKERLENKINSTPNIRHWKYKENKNDNFEGTNMKNFVSNESIPSVSSAVELNYSSEFGRHFVATRDINPGEVIVIEKPYAAVLSPPNMYTHCAHCFSRAWEGIPCEHCTCTMYCSEKCKSEAWAQYHDIECHPKVQFKAIGLNDLASFSLKIAILAVREYGSIKNLKKKLKKIDACEDYLMKSFAEDGIYHSDSYRTIYNLTTNEKYRQKNGIFTLSLNSSIILYYTYMLTSFFGENPNKSISDLCQNNDALFLGNLVAKHYMLIQMNDTEFGEINAKLQIKLGAVIGATTSLFNHSCNPNVSRCPVLKNNTMQQVVFSLYPIKQGSQLFDDYGFHFLTNPKVVRHNKLKQYFFKCNCPACDNVWPLFGDLPSILTIVKDKETKLEVARAIVRSKKYQRNIFDIGLDKFEGTKEDILENIGESIIILHKWAKKPTREFYELQEVFRQVFLLIYGNQLQLENPIAAHHISSPMSLEPY